MPRVQVKGTAQAALVDRDDVKKIPKSVWVDRARSKPKPMCRYEGVSMTLLRAVGLMAGLSPEGYVIPRNGDHFDCRRANALATFTLPTARLPVYKNSQSGVKGIRSNKGRYVVVLNVDGRPKTFGSSRDLAVAHDILDKARKLI